MEQEGGERGEEKSTKHQAREDRGSMGSEVEERRVRVRARERKDGDKPARSVDEHRERRVDEHHETRVGEPRVGRTEGRSAVREERDSRRVGSNGERRQASGDYDVKDRRGESKGERGASGRDREGRDEVHRSDSSRHRDGEERKGHRESGRRTDSRVSRDTERSGKDEDAVRAKCESHGRLRGSEKEHRREGARDRERDASRGRRETERDGAEGIAKYRNPEK